LGSLELIEALLAARRDVQVVALAERLDHCRHAKFWADVSAKRRILEEVETIYGPVAQRIEPALGRRFVHWSWAFGRSLGAS
jgi:(p)ppGpp synthase/HD superfamily hydrolase